MTQPGQQSEVANLLRQIELEYEAAHSGMYGLSAMASHAFITAKTENIALMQEELHQLVGDDAIRLVAQTLDHLTLDTP